MSQEHELVEIILVSHFLVQPLEESNAGKINRVGSEQHDQPEDKVQHESKTRSHRPHVLRPDRRAIKTVLGAHRSGQSIVSERLGQRFVRPNYSTQTRLNRVFWGEKVVFRGETARQAGGGCDLALMTQLLSQRALKQIRHLAMAPP